MQRIVPPSLLVWEYTSINKAGRAPALVGIEEMVGVGREGLLDKVVSKQRPSGSQEGGHADRGRTGIPASGNSKSPQGKTGCALKATVIEVEWAEGKASAWEWGEGRGLAVHAGPCRLRKGPWILPWVR